MTVKVSAPKPVLKKAIVLDTYGRVVIPAEMREALGLKAGDRLIARIVDNELRLITVRDGIRRAQEIASRVTGGEAGLVNEFIADRRREAQRE